MCGRYTLKADAGELAEVFELVSVAPFLPRWNLTPSQPGLIVRGGQPRAALPAIWGFRAHTGGPAPINARSETVADKPLFRGALWTSRAIVLADGYYEWQRTRDGRDVHKQPYYIAAPGGRPFAMAGLWTHCAESEGVDAHDTFCVMTTAPNDKLAAIHDRMPVLLGRRGAAAWLGEAAAGKAELLDLLRPCPEGWLDAWPVSERVNDPRNDGPDNVVEVVPRGPAQPSLLDLVEPPGRR